MGEPKNQAKSNNNIQGQKSKQKYRQSGIQSKQKKDDDSLTGKTVTTNDQTQDKIRKEYIYRKSKDFSFRKEQQNSKFEGQKKNFCQCTRFKCDTNRCKCFRQGSFCTPNCNCYSCKNFQYQTIEENPKEYLSDFSSEEYIKEQNFQGFDGDFQGPQFQQQKKQREVSYDQNKQTYNPVQEIEPEPQYSLSDYLQMINEDYSLSHKKNQKNVSEQKSKETYEFQNSFQQDQIFLDQSSLSQELLQLPKNQQQQFIEDVLLSFDSADSQLFQIFGDQDVKYITKRQAKFIKQKFKKKQTTANENTKKSIQFCSCHVNHCQKPEQNSKSQNMCGCYLAKRLCTTFCRCAGCKNPPRDCLQRKRQKSLFSQTQSVSSHGFEPFLFKAQQNQIGEKIYKSQKEPQTGDSSENNYSEQQKADPTKKQSFSQTSQLLQKKENEKDKLDLLDSQYSNDYSYNYSFYRSDSSEGFFFGKKQREK